MTDNEPRPSDILTVKLFSIKYPAFSQGAIRYLIFHSRSNGFEHCLRRAGRKILILESEFLAWLDSQNNRGGHA